MKPELTPEDLARIVAYVDGELTGEERERFEDELSENEALRDELESFLRLDVLERHFHATSTGGVIEGSGSNPRSTWRRSVPFVAAAAALLILAWAHFRPAASDGLQVAVASRPEDLFSTNRGPLATSPLLYLGFTAPADGFVRIFGQDDQGAWYATTLGAVEKERAVDAGPQRFGGYERTWTDERGEPRTYRAFVLLFSEEALPTDRVADALSELENATADDLRRALEATFDVRTGSVHIDSN